MAEPNTRAGFEVGLYLESADSPGIFEFICGITTKELSLERGLVQAPVNDCADPLSAPRMATSPGIETSTISGSGLIDTDHAEEMLWDWYKGTEARAARFRIKDGAEYAGNYVLTRLVVGGNGEGTEKATVSIEATADGLVERNASWVA